MLNLDLQMGLVWTELIFTADGSGLDGNSLPRYSAVELVWVISLCLVEKPCFSYIRTLLPLGKLFAGPAFHGQGKDYSASAEMVFPKSWQKALAPQCPAAPGYLLLHNLWVIHSRTPASSSQFDPPGQICSSLRILPLKRKIILSEIPSQES